LQKKESAIAGGKKADVEQFFFPQRRGGGGPVIVREKERMGVIQARRTTYRGVRMGGKKKATKYDQQTKGGFSSVGLSGKKEKNNWQEKEPKTMKKSRKGGRGEGWQKKTNGGEARGKPYPRRKKERR